MSTRQCRTSQPWGLEASPVSHQVSRSSQISDGSMTAPRTGPARYSDQETIGQNVPPAWPRPDTGSINLTELLENSAVGPLQIRVFTLCMVCLIMDGFDVQAMGYVAPAVLREWGMRRPGAWPGVCRRELRRAARVVGLQHGGRQDRPAAGDRGGHVFLLRVDHRHRLRARTCSSCCGCGSSPASAWAASSHMPRRSSASSARSAVARHADDVHHCRLHRRRGRRRVRGRVADPGVRLALGVHFRRRRAVRHRRRDGGGACPSRSSSWPCGEHSTPRW